MRMNLVKENGLEREYYFGRKRNMVSYYKYKWSKEANKYFPYYNETFKDNNNVFLMQELKDINNLKSYFVLFIY